MLNDARILIIRLGGMGDVIFTLPAVCALREAFPRARLSYLTDRAFVPLLEGFGEFETVRGLDRAACKALNLRVLLGGTAGLLLHVKQARYRLVLDFQSFGETAWLTWLSRAPDRWGSVYRPGRSWAYTRPVRRNPALHPVDYNLQLLREAGGLTPASHPGRFTVPESALCQARDMYQSHQLDPQRQTILFHPFTSTPQKNWPLEHYLAVARMARQSGLQVLFGGGPADAATLEPARLAGYAVTAGAPLMVSGALASLATLVVGGDTGLPHLALAMGRRVLIIMGSIGAGACYPYGHPEWTVVPPEGSPVSAVPADAVWRACSGALADMSGQAPGAGQYSTELHPEFTL